MWRPYTPVPLKCTRPAPANISFLALLEESLFVVFFQFWVAVFNLPTFDDSQCKQFVFKEKLHGSRDAIGR